MFAAITSPEFRILAVSWVNLLREARGKGDRHFAVDGLRRALLLVVVHTLTRRYEDREVPLLPLNRRDWCFSQIRNEPILLMN